MTFIILQFILFVYLKKHHGWIAMLDYIINYYLFAIITVIIHNDMFHLQITTHYILIHY